MALKHALALSFFAVSLCLIAAFQVRAQKSPDSLRTLLRSHPKNDSARVDIINELAFASYLSRLSDLEVYAASALTLAKKIGYKRGEGTAYEMQGIYYSLENGDPVASERFNRALKIFRNIHYTRGISHTLNHIGSYYELIQQEQQALAFYLKALKSYKGDDLPFEMGLDASIGLAYVKLKDFTNADDYTNKMFVLAVKSKDTAQIASAYSNLAFINFTLGNHIIALDLVNKAFKLARRSNKVTCKTIVQLNTIAGKVYLDLRSYVKARNYLVRSLQLAKKINSPALTSENYLNIYRLDSAVKGYRDALRYLLLSKNIDDSLASDARNQQLALYRIKYEAERNMSDNQVLRAEKHNNQIVIDQQRITVFLLAAGLGLIILMVIYLQFANKEILNKNSIIKKQNTNLKHINVVKDKLFSVVSHDLRGPLLQMKGLLNLFQTHEVNDQEMKELTPKVQENLDKTLELVDNLLIWSKNQMQGFTVKPSQFDLYQLAQDNLQSFKNQALQKSIGISNDIELKLSVFADREMINIVLRNLISNAVKFTPEAGKIRISSSRTERLITISVDDTGVGVKKEVLERIFSFVNLSTPGTLNEKGSGVGLKLCKDFVELNQGKIWMTKKETGGSVFSFSLPVFQTTN